MNFIKEIRNKIEGIKNTKKITKAMEMVTVFKIRKSQKKMFSSKLYLSLLNKLIKNIYLFQNNIKKKHQYIYNNKIIKNIGYILITTDKGLCGNFNNNLFKLLSNDIKKWKEKSINIKSAVIGCKGLFFLKKNNIQIVSQITNIKTNDINISKIISIIKYMLNLYKKSYIDKLFIVYNKYVNNVIQTPKIFQILPLSLNEINKKNIEKNNYLYEPNFYTITNYILNKYIQLQIYNFFLENLVGEYASRIITMKTATDNADHFIKDLQLLYNKVRQSNITQELNEIITGASAMK
ncbi:ATP synthase F1 subunit gamma [Enterobacteriaceae endosymbiont of Plateumaris consimilis]|uniref:ATP synthase F1 subunit gamma n=1 Tax=Enterobacteriaceae endosymbiont of Plateumaris consimilis TaxID=2675794 RepID=UPI001448A472|nr:ATP synthase F1 subunit gamma [Enterobacteriaceae endosymbiont of Plateumaris consimilis]QJC28798.1 ATP synthase F1 subunit gamma [Enterobacteriaceae endosymbiont of Plateumaris consimilis]